MKIGDRVLHNKYGIGEITKINADQVTCLLAGAYRTFTTEAAQAMVKAADNSRGTTGADFRREEKRYPCSFCSGSFETPIGCKTHETQCKENPNAKQWKSVTVKPEVMAARKEVLKKRSKKRGAPPGNKNAKKPQDIKKPKVSHHSVDRMHEIGRHPQTISILRNALTARWLVFLNQDGSSNKTLNQLRADFTQELFKEFEI
ncbi:MAG: hypothetical protein PHY28_04355 [Dehalococcoidales bacterium]|nr:hypothetical protein [Dehalococcoidales bacterium]